MVGIQVFRREFHTHIHLDYAKVKFLSFIKKKKNLSCIKKKKELSIRDIYTFVISTHHTA